MRLALAAGRNIEWFQTDAATGETAAEVVIETRDRLELIAREMSTMRAMALGLWVLQSLAAAGCIAGQERSYPLYPPADPPPPREQLARLTGYVQFVDGQDVAPHGSSFDLLPGCHVIGTPKTWGAGHSEFGGWTMDTGRLNFALPMKPGYFYSVEVQSKSEGGQSGRFSIGAYEKDASGNTTRKFAPVLNHVDPSTCSAGA